MKKIKQYIVLADKMPSSFCIRLNELITKGWQPYYGLIVREECLYQALIKYEEPLISNVNLNLNEDEMYWLEGAISMQMGEGGNPDVRKVLDNLLLKIRDQIYDKDD